MGLAQTELATLKKKFYRIIKSKKIRVSACIRHENIQKPMADYINFYNDEKLHSSLNYFRPSSLL